jgi:hypothetical protein
MGIYLAISDLQAEIMVSDATTSDLKVLGLIPCTCTWKASHK